MHTPRRNDAAALAGLRLTGNLSARAVPTNALLTKDGVGRARPSCYELPGEGFAYGRVECGDTEGAREVAFTWVGHQPSARRESCEPDFVRSNVRAASLRAVNSKDIKLYRREWDELTPRYRGGRPPRGERPALPSDARPGFAYGKKVPPSTPIQMVMAHRWGDRAERDLDTFYAELGEQKELLKSRVQKISLTHASRGHGYPAKQASLRPDEPEELFKMGKFKRVPSRVDHRRPAEAPPTARGGDCASRGQSAAKCKKSRSPSPAPSEKSRAATPASNAGSCIRPSGLPDSSEDVVALNGADVP